MKTPVSPLIAISFLIQSCHTYTTINSKENPLFAANNYTLRQIPLFESTTLFSINESSLIVSKYNIQKTTLISEIKTENKIFQKVADFLISFEQAIAIPIETLNSDFVFDDYTFSKN